MYLCFIHFSCDSVVKQLHLNKGMTHNVNIVCSHVNTNNIM